MEMFIEVGLYLIVLGVLAIANIALGMYANIAINKLKFKWNVFIIGAIKALIVAFGFYALTFAMYEIPEIGEAVGVDARAILVLGVVVYFTKVALQLKDILGLGKEDK